jgi:NhaP-type Na+/H+ or K+/H+ antiporter
VTTLLVYAGTLVAAVLISDRAHRTVLSTAVLFLVAGALMGFAGAPASEEIIRSLADLALVAVLFTDGMRIPLRDLRAAWHLPGRALLLGFPLTLAGTAVAARLLVDVPWPAALLLGAALAPTDPVFASAIVGREEVPGRLRHLLNVESGLNDGLALPFVVAFIAWSREREIEAPTIAGELALGIALGIVVPWIAVRLERSRFFAASEQYRPIGVFAVGLLVYALALWTSANEFLAAFAAGITLATVEPRAHVVFGGIGGSATELLKLAALLVFGSLLSPRFLGELPAGGWVFAIVAPFAVRPLAIAIALAGADLTRREKLVAAWFGPKGFASVVYGLLVGSTKLPRGDLIFHLIAITTALSILLHSSTDVPVAHWFERQPAEGRGPA